MDQLLQMIQSADPTDNQSDSVELLQLEGEDPRLETTLYCPDHVLILLRSADAKSRSCLCDLIIVCV